MIRSVPDHAEPADRDRITPEERRAIDAFIAAGKVTICPPCRFTEMAWKGWGGVGARRAEGKLQRQEKVASLAARYTAPQIAAQLGVAESTVYLDMRQLGIDPVPPRRDPKGGAE